MKPFVETRQLDTEIAEKDRQIENLALEIERQEELIASFYAEYDVSYQQVAAFAENKERFSEKDWQALEKMRQDLEDKLNLALSTVGATRKAQKTRQAQSFVRPSWIFVR
ncbi:MAG: hypothetical protein K0S07_1789 [Chlamydiales bacterium]|jgi:uncharacterized protein (DUF3084 family)|nr:hypothetical protein [Chlamydiales bacterium]